MKTPLRLLPLLGFSRPLLADGDLGQTEICGLGGSLILGGSGCFADQKPLTQCQDGECGGPKQHAWTHSSACFQGQHAEQPICAFTETTFADGRGMSLVTTPKRASYIASSPAFTSPETVHGINQDLNRTVPAKYEMRYIPGKGMGLIATSHIYRGDLIMANTASLMIDYRAFNELTKPEYTSLQAAAVSQLPPFHAARLLALSPHTTNTSHLTREELIDMIAATNGFDIDPDDDDPDQHHSFFVLFPEIARMNHDCRPNAEYHYDAPRLAQHIRAARDVAPGEEITLSYINPLMVRALRTARLQRNWGFACSCPLCTLERERAEESDRRIEQIGEIKAELGVWADPADEGAEAAPPPPGRTGKASPAMAELLVALYEMERLWGLMHEAYMLAALEHNGVGEAWTAVKYARLGLEWGIPMLAEEDEDLEELRALAADPWGHWSWRRRVEVKGKGGGR